MTGTDGRQRRLVRIARIVAAIVAASLLTACAQAHPVPRAPDGDPIQAARELPDAPDAVREGTAAESCGEFVLPQGGTIPADAVDCLATAASLRQSAELSWATPTVEGDPIVYFALVADGSDEVTVHTTNAFDSFGGDPSWTTKMCTTAAVATSPDGC